MAWQDAVRDIAGEEGVLSGEEAYTFSADGVRPQVVVFPRTVEQVCEILRVASENRLAVVPWGGGTKQHFGFPPRKVDLVLCLQKLNQVVEYTPDDMTVIAQAGMTLAQLQSVLSERHQFLPLDPPLPERATIGGILATNASGPSRCAYGTARDYLIGIKVVQPDGSVTKFGGKVVKNVAGYDLHKLYIGSLGTLGVIVEANFKIRPLPETGATLLASVPYLETADRICEALIHSDLHPTFVELLNAAASRRLPVEGEMANPYWMLFGFDEVEEAVQWQIGEMLTLLAQVGLGEGILLSGGEQERLRSVLRDLPAHPEAALVFKINVLSSTVTAFFHYAEQLMEEAGQTLKSSGGAMLSRALNGIVYLLVWDLPSDAPAFAQKLLQVATELGGNMVIERAPTALKSDLPLWGRQREDFKLMKGLKEKLDPQSILNPGRFVGGI